MALRAVNEIINRGIWEVNAIYLERQELIQKGAYTEPQLLDILAKCKRLGTSLKEANTVARVQLIRYPNLQKQCAQLSSNVNIQTAKLKKLIEALPPKQPKVAVPLSSKDPQHLTQKQRTPNKEARLAPPKQSPHQRQIERPLSTPKESPKDTQRLSQECGTTREKRPDLLQRRQVERPTPVPKEPRLVQVLRDALKNLQSGKQKEALEQVGTLATFSPTTLNNIFAKTWEAAGKPTPRTNPKIAHDKFGKIAFFDYKGTTPQGRAIYADQRICAVAELLRDLTSRETPVIKEATPPLCPKKPSEKKPDGKVNISRVAIPCTIHCNDPALRAKATTIFKMLYSKQFFGSGKEACSLVLDAFAWLSSRKHEDPITISIEDLSEYETSCFDKKLGRYIPLKRSIVLDSRLLRATNIDDLNNEDLKEFMSTVIHEMTHAVHFDGFNTALFTTSENLREELGCTRTEYSKALEKAASLVPRFDGFPRLTITLLAKMLMNYEDPKNHFYAGRLERAFNEFFARFPEMHCLHGRSNSREEIDAALEKIFPLGHRFFWGAFRRKCEEYRTLFQH